MRNRGQFAYANAVLEMPRGFGFLRFDSSESSKAFLERNYPTIHLHGGSSKDGDEQAAKVRVAYSRERDDKSRGAKADIEWLCQNVSKMEPLIGDFDSVTVQLYQLCRP